MTDEEYSNILAAGVEFYTSLKDLVEKHNLEEDHIPSIVMVAVGAIMSTTPMTPEQLAEGVKIVQRFWTVDPESDLPLNARFGKVIRGN